MLLYDRMKCSQNLIRIGCFIRLFTESSTFNVNAEFEHKVYEAYAPHAVDEDICNKVMSQHIYLAVSRYAEYEHLHSPYCQLYHQGSQRCSGTGLGRNLARRLYATVPMSRM